MPRGRALSLEAGPAAARALRWLAILALVANWAYLIAAGR